MGQYDDLPDGGEQSTSFSYPVYQQLRKQSSGMESLFAFKPLNRQTVTVNGHAEAVTAEMVSGNYYSSLGVRPQLGRGVQESDDGSPGSGPVVVISDRFWMKEFARAPNVIGKTILVNVTPMTIVGVNPPRVHWRVLGARNTGYLPALQHAADRGAAELSGSVPLRCLPTRTSGGCW